LPEYKVDGFGLFDLNDLDFHATISFRMIVTK
jgi:hypothetical protein